MGTPDASTVSVSMYDGMLIGGYCVSIGSSTVTLGNNGNP